MVFFHNWDNSRVIAAVTFLLRFCEHRSIFPPAIGWHLSGRELIMTLDRFVVFVAVAERGSVTRAAEQLHISQPAVTKQLKGLEKDCNAKLYKGIGRGIELTERGRAFLREVKALLKRYEKLKEKFGSASGSSAVETLTVGGSYSPSVEFLPFVLDRFRRTHPLVHVNLRTANRFDMERLILNSEVDIAVLTNARSNSSLTMEPYRPEPLVAFVARNQPLAARQKLTSEEFDRVPLLIRKGWKGRGTNERLLQELKKKGLTPNIAMRCESPEAVKAAVKRKMGVGILFKETIETELKRGEFKIVKLPVKNLDGKSFIVYLKDRPLSKNTQDLLNLLRELQQRALGRQTRTKLPENLTKDI